MPNKEGVKNEDDFGDVILLNKICEGSWLTGEENTDNIAGETIDFIKADNRKQYVFLVPHGDCPKDVEVKVTGKKTTSLNWSLSKKPLYAKYLVLTGPARTTKDENEKGKKKTVGSTFFIHYVVELAEKMHGFPRATSPRGLKDKIKGWSEEEVKQFKKLIGAFCSQSADTGKLREQIGKTGAM